MRNQFYISILINTSASSSAPSDPRLCDNGDGDGDDGSVVDVQYIPRNMHTFFALLCFVVVIHWLIFPYPSGLLHWHCGNLTIAPVPAKQPSWIWINTSCEFIMNDCITTTKQSTTKPCAYFLGYTVFDPHSPALAPTNHGWLCLEWSTGLFLPFIKTNPWRRRDYSLR